MRLGRYLTTNRRSVADLRHIAGKLKEGTLLCLVCFEPFDPRLQRNREIVLLTRQNMVLSAGIALIIAQVEPSGGISSPDRVKRLFSSRFVPRILKSERTTEWSAGGGF